MVLPQGYDGLTAADKQGVLWKNCTDTRYDAAAIAANSSDAPALQAAQIMLPTYTHTTFLNASDELPDGRIKVIHRRGCAAKIELRMAAGTKPTFTGIFGASTMGLVRFSLGRMAHPPFAPAAALKFLIDGQKVCLHSADGQDTDVNYFRNVFSSIFPPPQSTAMKAIDAAFTVSIKTLPGPPKDWPPAARNLPLYDAAKISPDGTPVTNVVDPYQVFFTPTAEVTSLYEAVKDQDFRAALQSIKPGTVLWEVTGKRTSDDAEAPVPIGQLVLTSEVVACSYCDDSLFFQHMRHQRP